MGVRDRLCFARQWEAARKLQHWWRCSSYRRNEAVRKKQQDVDREKTFLSDAVCFLERERNECGIAVQAAIREMRFFDLAMMTLRTQAADEVAKAEGTAEAMKTQMADEAAKAEMKVEAMRKELLKEELEKRRFMRKANDAESALAAAKKQANSWKTYAMNTVERLSQKLRQARADRSPSRNN